MKRRLLLLACGLVALAWWVSSLASPPVEVPARVARHPNPEITSGDRLPVRPSAAPKTSSEPVTALDPHVDHLRRWQELMGGGVVTCTVGPMFPDGGMYVTLVGELPHAYPRDDQVPVRDGRIALGVPPGDGAASLEVPAVARGRVTWEGAGVGQVVECSGFQKTADLVAIRGRVVGADGAVVPRAGVEGCGEHASTNWATGAFEVFVEPGTCTLEAVLRRNMGRSAGEPVTLSIVAGEPVADVVLVAPEEPEWRDPTPEEAEESRARLCEYWTGHDTRMFALFQLIADRHEPGTAAYDDAQRRLQERRDEMYASRAELCDAVDPDTGTSADEDTGMEADSAAVEDTGLRLDSAESGVDSAEGGGDTSAAGTPRL